MSKVTLESAAISFEQWRIQRKSRIEPIPEALWAMAVSLYPEHKSSHICRRLGLSGSQFKRHLKNRDCPDGGFVLATADIDKANLKPAPEVILGIEGHQRTLTLKVTIDALSRILPHIEALL